MNPLIVSEFGANLSVDHFRLNVRSRKTLIHSFAPHKISFDTVVLDSPFGSVSLDANRWCAKHGISIIQLDFEGKVISQTVSSQFQNLGKLKLAQLRAYDDPLKRLLIAKAIIRAKTGKEIPKWVTTLTKVKTFEGLQAERYWKDYAVRVREANDRFEFTQRDNSDHFNYNATSEINALLNFGFTGILEPVIRKYIHAVGLLPEVGYLHEVSAHKEPLVYDLMEPFRFLICESILKLLPKLRQTDFTYERKDIRLRLKPSTIHQLIQETSRTLESDLWYKEANWRCESIVLDYVRELASALQRDKIPEFNPLD